MARKAGEGEKASRKAGGGGRQALMEALKAFVRTEGGKFLDDPNVTSIGIGHKITKGQRTNQLCVQFTVRKKKAVGPELEALGSKAIPKTLQVGAHKVPTDVIEREYHPKFKLIAEAVKDERKQRLDTIVPGISVGHPSTTAGTLGAIVYDAHDGQPCVLSNWHVLNTPEGKPGDAMLQPGPYDDNRVSENRAGTLLRSHLGLAGDCAIASISGRRYAQTVFALTKAPTRIARPELGDKVVKSGRTTAVTYGIVRRVDTVVKINYGGSVGEQRIGAFEIGPDPKRPAANHQISMGGDSGSVWLVMDDKGQLTDIMVGLHFAGESEGDSDDHAMACYAHSVLEKLEISLQPLGPAPLPAAAAGAQGSGFDENFLSSRVPFPSLTQDIASDVVKLQGSPRLHYTHYSVCMSKSRRMAWYVAWNIDGNRIRQYGRKGLQFVLDPRIDKKYQWGDELYVGNKLDRGHIARRADLVWGTPTEAQQANKDSFYFTNITPQHQAFNQSERSGLWGKLENAILEEVDVENLRVSVMGGPLFSDTDMKYREARIPGSFWKLIAFVDTAEKKFKVKAYVLSQKDLLNDIEALELDAFRLWQVSLPDLEQRTKLRFTGLGNADAFKPRAVSQALSAASENQEVREIRSYGEMVADL
jgi:endonuclease G